MAVPVPFFIANLVMTGSFIPWVIPNMTNTFLIQSRTAVDIEISTDAAGVNKFTLKSGKGITLGSFNTNNQVIYFNGAAAVVVEIIQVRLP